MPNNPALPSWLTRTDKGVMTADIDTAYPIVLEAIGVSNVDQYWVEVAYQCTKMAIQDIVAGTDHDPRPNKGLVIDMKYSEKDKWALSSFPAGRGVAAGGKEVRMHYETSGVRRRLMAA